MSNSKLLLIVLGLLLFAANATAGTILLMQIGTGTPGSSPPPTCTNKLDFSQACNTQYITAIGL